MAHYDCKRCGNARCVDEECGNITKLLEPNQLPASSIDHPKHYNIGQFEVIDVLEDWGLDNDFLLGNTIKYIARHRHKGNALEDLKKAKWYLDRKIQNMEKKNG